MNTIDDANKRDKRRKKVRQREGKNGQKERKTDRQKASKQRCPVTFTASLA